MPFAPSDISGLKVWLKADALGLSDNDPVSTFTDQSGTSHDFTASGSQRPTFKTNIQNGLAVVRFDGSDDQLSGGDLSGVFTAAASAFLVFSTADTSRMAIYQTKLNDPWWSFDGAGYWGLFRSARLDNTPSSGLGVTGWHAWSLTADGSTYKMRLDQVSKISGGGFTFDGGNAHLMGYQSQNGHHTAMDLGEVIIYDSVVSDANRDNVENYIAARWATSTPGVTIAAGTDASTAATFAPTVGLGALATSSLPNGAAATNAPTVRTDRILTSSLPNATAATNGPSVSAGNAVAIGAGFPNANATTLTPSVVTSVFLTATLPNATTATFAPVIVRGSTLSSSLPNANAATFGPAAIALLVAPMAEATASADHPLPPSFVGGPGAVGPGVGATRSRRALTANFGALGELNHVFVSVSGEVDYPVVGDFECDEQVPGGYWTATGLIARSERKTAFGVYSARSHWYVYEAQTGDLIWHGKLLQPQEEESQIRLNADGPGKYVTERAIHHRLLYQTFDLSEWEVGQTAAPFANDPGNTLETDAEETSLGDTWTVEIGDGIIFTRPARKNAVPASSESSISIRDRSPTVRWFADDIAEPGVTRMAFTVHTFIPADNSLDDSGITSNRPVMFKSEPYPIFFKLDAARWDPRLAPGSQGGRTLNVVRWFPDTSGAGSFNFGENFNWWLRWEISFFYIQTYDGIGTYTPTAGYSPAPFAYSDRLGDASEDLTTFAPTSNITQEDGSGRRWNNRPLDRPAGLGAGLAGQFDDVSTNYIDPAISSPADGGVFGPYEDYWDQYPINMIAIQWADMTANGVHGDQVETAKAQMLQVRVNSIAFGDYFSATDLYQDLAGRLGLQTYGIDQMGYNILPYDLKEGTFGDGLDHAALLSSSIWRVVTDSEGGNNRLDAMHWGEGNSFHWQVDDDRQQHNLVPTATYRSIAVPFMYPGKSGLSGTARVRWRDAPPQTGGDYGVVSLNAPLPKRDQAENLAWKLLDRLRHPRLAGSLTLATVSRKLNLRESAYSLHAGDVIDHMPSGSQRLRIKSVRKTYEGVDVELEDQNAVVDALIERANHSLLRIQRTHGG